MAPIRTTRSSPNLLVKSTSLPYSLGLTADVMIALPEKKPTALMAARQKHFQLRQQRREANAKARRAAKEENIASKVTFTPMKDVVSALRGVDGKRPIVISYRKSWMPIANALKAPLPAQLNPRPIY